MSVCRVDSTEVKAATRTTAEVGRDVEYVKSVVGKFGAALVVSYRQSSTKAVVNQATARVLQVERGGSFRV